MNKLLDANQPQTNQCSILLAVKNYYWIYKSLQINGYIYIYFSRQRWFNKTENYLRLCSKFICKTHPWSLAAYNLLLIVVSCLDMYLALYCYLLWFVSNWVQSGPVNPSTHWQLQTPFTCFTNPSFWQTGGFVQSSVKPFVSLLICFDLQFKKKSKTKYRIRWNMFSIQILPMIIIFSKL